MSFIFVNFELLKVLLMTIMTKFIYLCLVGGSRLSQYTHIVIFKP